MPARPTTTHPSGHLPSLYVYPRIGQACGTSGNWEANHLWESEAITLLKTSLPIAKKPSDADLFLVDECLNLEYFSKRESKHSCKHCQKLDAELVALMRATGHYWDAPATRARHIISHPECPRMDIVDPLDVQFPNIWGRSLNTIPGVPQAMVLCAQSSRPGRPDAARTLHVPFYSHRKTGIYSILPAAERAHDFFFAGTFSSGWPRGWLREALQPANSSVLQLFSTRAPSDAELKELTNNARRARFIIVPPGDTPETPRIYAALAYGTPPLFIEDVHNEMRPQFRVFGGCDLCAGTLRLAGAPPASWRGMSLRLEISEIFPNGVPSLLSRQRPRTFASLPKVKRLLDPKAYDELLGNLSAHREEALWGTEAFRTQFLKGVHSRVHALDVSAKARNEAARAGTSARPRSRAP